MSLTAEPPGREREHRRSWPWLLGGVLVAGLVAVGSVIWVPWGAAEPGDERSAAALEVADRWARGWEVGDGAAVASVFAADGFYEDFFGNRVSADDMARYASTRARFVDRGERVGEMTWLGVDDDGHDVFVWVQQFDWVETHGGTFRGLVEMDLDDDLAARIAWVSDAYEVGPDGAPPPGDDIAVGLARRWARGWADDEVGEVVSVFADGSEYVDFSGRSVPDERMAWFVSPLVDEVAGTRIVGDVTWLGVDDHGEDVYAWVQQFDWTGDDPGTFRGPIEMDVDGTSASRIEWVSEVYGASAGGRPPAMEREDLGAETGPVLVGGGETTVYNGSPALNRLLEWGLARFELAGLAPPEVASVTFTQFSDFCEEERGHVVITASGAEITLCFHEDDACRDDACGTFVPGVAAVVLHELAHVWMHGAVGDATRDAFMDAVGSETWADPSVPWADRAVEQAADTLAWGLMDRDIVMLRIGQPPPRQLAEWYRILTRTDPLVDVRSP